MSKVICSSRKLCTAISLAALKIVPDEPPKLHIFLAILINSDLSSGISWNVSFSDEKLISEKFNNGMEFFSSFGGNPVSCKIASEVINEIESKDLQKNAMTIGNYLKKGLNSLATKHPIIGDVRGKGLFIGFELVDEKLNPLENKAIYLKNRMKDLGFLMSNDGIDHNVIKIKPPMIFNKKNADDLLFFLDLVLQEDYIKYG